MSFADIFADDSFPSISKYVEEAKMIKINGTKSVFESQYVKTTIIDESDSDTDLKSPSTAYCKRNSIKNGVAGHKRKYSEDSLAGFTKKSVPKSLPGHNSPPPDTFRAAKRPNLEPVMPSSDAEEEENIEASEGDAEMNGGQAEGGEYEGKTNSVKPTSKAKANSSKTLTKSKSTEVGKSKSKLDEKSNESEKPKSNPKSNSKSDPKSKSKSKFKRKSDSNEIGEDNIEDNNPEPIEESDPKLESAQLSKPDKITKKKPAPAPEPVKPAKNTTKKVISKTPKRQTLPVEHDKPSLQRIPIIARGKKGARAVHGLYQNNVIPRNSTTSVVINGRTLRNRGKSIDYTYKDV